MTFTIAGIDEAGRGAVLGPMVIAGVSVIGEDERKLRDIGVKDSKLLSPSARKRLYRTIEEIARDIIVLKISPCKIDDYNRKGVNLNRLEAMKMAEILDCLEPSKGIVDAPESNTERFRETLGKMIKGKTEIVSENRADVKYPVVSAASIIAKVERDRSIDSLRKRFGVRGSGYPSDERTISWMRSYLKEHGSFPREGLVRFSWDTTKKMLGEKKQSGIGSFFRRKKG